ncbi:CheR family methyltransferase [Euryhalocaulis caribicus]|uniref:CheR family methyltransferase n=1 Tax=Euryhalocaulis caribicus TaxID=1161401 RepID=UPI0003AA1BC8|nr:protein-glutamate O-methyltransferase CheR [Euryhalocaulis caribicus]
MSQSWINALEDMALRRAGLSLTGLDRKQIEARLSPLARREGYDNAEALSRAALARPEERLAYEVVEALAPGKTRFFGQGFETFREMILPDLVRRSENRPVRIWSAGCATGQEAYSLAMLAAADGVFAAPGRCEIIATDYSESAIDRAQSGRFSRMEVQTGLPVRMLVQHFEQDGEMWRARTHLRRSVDFRTLNLMAELEPLGEFDCIVLRGVVARMPADIAAKTLSRVAARLQPGGWLMLGEGERTPQTFGRLDEAGAPGLYQALDRVPA